jgi:hypothetical protein
MGVLARIAEYCTYVSCTCPQIQLDDIHELRILTFYFNALSFFCSYIRNGDSEKNSE